MKSRKQIDKVFGEGLGPAGPQSYPGKKLTDPSDPLIWKVVTQVQNYIGDVVGEETTEEEAREEAWTLAIDAANELISDRKLAIAVAKEAAHQVGYTPKGYRPLKRKPANDKPVSLKRADDPLEPKERIVKPTGVVHGPYRPTFLGKQ